MKSFQAKSLCSSYVSFITLTAEYKSILSLSVACAFHNASNAVNALYQERTMSINSRGRSGKRPCKYLRLEYLPTLDILLLI